MTEHNASTPCTRYQTTEYNRSERLISRLHDIYGAAKSFHSSHEEILANMRERIYSTRDFQKLTPYYRGVFDGIRRILLDNLYRYHLEWRVSLDGKLIPSKEVPDGRWNEVQSDAGRHVWKDAPERVF